MGIKMEWKNWRSSPCNLCPRNCQVNRTEGQRGFCGAPDAILLARAALHMWEEPCISGESGSGTVFFGGCNLRCVYCQNYEISTGTKGKCVSPERLAEIFLELQEKGAANINLVTPDHYIPQVAWAISAARDRGMRIPVVYNGSGYERREMIRDLKGLVDVYLTDFKYMDASLAEKYSAAPDYPQVAREALDEMVKAVGEPFFDERGMMQRGVIVRHLLLPGHRRNARDVIRYVYETWGDGVYLSLMSQYTPPGRLREDPALAHLARKVTRREYETVVDYALELGVKNAFIQEGDVAKESFVPEFEGEGI